MEIKFVFSFRKDHIRNELRFELVSKRPPIPLTDASFAQLYEQYKSSFVVVARSYVRDSIVAEDIVSDCFISCWENRGKIDCTQNIPAYIHTSVKNSCLNFLRNQITRLKVQQKIHSSAQRIMVQSIATLETNDPESLFAEEIAHIIEHELEMMPHTTKSIFLAARFDEMTYKEVAEKFGLSVNQVNFEIRKASKILKAALKDYFALLLITWKTVQNVL